MLRCFKWWARFKLSALGSTSLLTDLFISIFFLPSSSPLSRAEAFVQHLLRSEINVRAIDATHVAISFDETTTLEDVQQLVDLAASFRFVPAP